MAAASASPIPVLPEVPSITVPPGLSSPFFLRGFEHRGADTVFHAAAGIQIFELGQKCWPQSPAHAIETHHRRVADDLKNVVMPHSE